MVDTPAPASAPETGTPSGAAGFFQRETAGLPNWVWLVVIVGGLAVAVVIRHFANAASGTSSSTSANDQAGIGGAIIDPSTGLPYGNPYGYPYGYPYSGLQPPSPLPPLPQPPIAPNPILYNPPVKPLSPTYPLPPPNPPTFTPPGGGASHVMTSEHPQPGSTLASLAAMHGTTLDQLVRLNPGLDPLPGAGTAVRIR